MNAISTSKKNPAIGLVILMLSSLLLAGVVAEVNDGNVTTGIDRNPNPQEADGFKPGQEYDAATTHSKQNVQLSNGMKGDICLLYTSPSPRDRTRSRMPSSA